MGCRNKPYLAHKDLEARSMPVQRHEEVTYPPLIELDPDLVASIGHHPSRVRALRNVIHGIGL